MAEINSGDVIAKEAIKEVLDFKDAILSSSTALKELVKTGKDLGVNIKQAESTKQLRTETTKLTQSQIELQKIEKQIEVANARATKAYQDQQKALQNLKKEQNDRLVLGAKDAKQINEQNASVKQLEAALNKNRVAYKALADEESRSSKEGKELKAIIDQQDASVKKLNGDLGDFTDNVGNYEGSVKGLKLELKAARDEMVKIAATTGTTSKEFADASTKAGEIKDKINDLNDALKNSSASKFENIGTSLKDVGSKLLNLDFEGAATSAKQFATVVKSLTFAEVIAGVQSFGNTLAVVGKAILTNPLFYIAAAVAGIALAFKYFYDQQQKASALTIERYKKEEEALLSRYDKEIKLQKIIGNQTFELEKARQKIIIESANKQLEELTQRKSGIQELLKAGMSLSDATKFAAEVEKNLNEDKKKQVEELTKAKRDASNEIEVIQAEQDEFERKSSADLAKQKKEDLLSLNKFRLQVQIDFQKELSDNEDESFNNRIKAIKKYTNIKNQLAKLEYDDALNQENLTDSAILLLKEQYQNKILENKKSSSKDEKRIEDERLKEGKANLAKSVNNYDEAIKQIISDRKLQIEADALAAKEQLDTVINGIKQEVIIGRKTREEGDKEIIEAQKRLSDDYIEIQIDRIQKLLIIQGLGKEEQLALDKELIKLRTDLQTAYYSQIEDDRNENLDKEKKQLIIIQGIYSNFANAINTAFQAISDNRLSELDNESDAVQKNLDKQLKAAGDNEEEKNRLNAQAQQREAQIEQKRRAERRKTAVTEKITGIFSAGISAALAVLNALSTVHPYPAAVVAAISAGILGAAQVVAIASKPIPNFFVGTNSAPGGKAWVGERGAELMRKPGGIFELTPSSATLMDVPRGTEIVPHDQTMKMLAMSALKQNGGSVQEKDSALLNEVKKLNSNIGNVKQASSDSSRAYISGLMAYEAKKVSDNHIKHQRIISLGKWVK